MREYSHQQARNVIHHNNPVRRALATDIESG